MYWTLTNPWHKKQNKLIFTHIGNRYSQNLSTQVHLEQKQYLISSTIIFSSQKLPRTILNICLVE